MVWDFMENNINSNLFVHSFHHIAIINSPFYKWVTLAQNQWNSNRSTIPHYTLHPTWVLQIHFSWWAYILYIIKLPPPPTKKKKKKSQKKTKKKPTKQKNSFASCLIATWDELNLSKSLVASLKVQILDVLLSKQSNVFLKGISCCYKKGIQSVTSLTNGRDKISTRYANILCLQIPFLLTKSRWITSDKYTSRWWKPKRNPQSKKVLCWEFKFPVLSLKFTWLQSVCLIYCWLQLWKSKH